MKSLRYKIGFGYLVLTVVIILLGILAAINFFRLSHALRSILEQHAPRALAVQNMISALDDQTRDQIVMLSGDVDAADESWGKNRDRFLNWWQNAKDLYPTHEEQVLMDSVLIAYRSYVTSSRAFYRLCRHADPLARPFHIESIVPLQIKVRALCRRMFECNQKSSTHNLRMIKEITDTSLIIMTAAATIAILFALYANSLVTRHIIKPAEKLSHTIRQIRAGSMNPKIDITSDDEFGTLASEFNKMTERLRSYEETNIHELIAEKKKSEAIVQSIAEPVIVTDEADNIILMNQAAVSMLKLTDKRWQGRSIQTVIGDHRVRSLLSVNQFPPHDTSPVDHLISISRGNDTFYYRPKQTQIFDEEGRSQGIVTLFEDVTRFKDLDRLKSDFIATVSHEFRTPLTSIHMTIDILSRQLIGPITDQQAELLANAKEDCDRLTKLVKNLLDLSRLESGKYPFKKEPLQMDKIIRSALKPLQLQYQEKGIQLIERLPKRLPIIYGDEEQIHWVITNIAQNALKHTPPGGRVIVSCKRSHHELILSISDTGPGIPAEALATIFDKFVQVKSDHSSTPGSVGLGLAIAKEVVEAHGGRIWVESMVGRGSTFYFSLPMMRAR